MELNVKDGRMYYGQELVGESSQNPGFKNLIFEDKPLFVGEGYVTFRAIHIVTNLKEIVEIRLLRDEKDDLKREMYNNIREIALRELNVDLSNCITTRFDAGSYSYPTSLFYSIMESTRGVASIKEYRRVRASYFPTNSSKFELDNSTCKASIKTSIDLLAGFLKSLINLYANGLSHGNLNPENILWFLDDINLDKALKRLSGYENTNFKRLEPFKVKFVDTGILNMPELDNAAMIRDSFRIFEQVKALLMPLFNDTDLDFTDCLNFDVMETGELAQYGVTKICTKKDINGEVFFVHPYEMAADFYRLISVLFIAFKLVTNSKEKEKYSILLDGDCANDLYYLMYEDNFRHYIDTFSFECMDTLNKLDKLDSDGRLIDWKKLWTLYPLNRIDINPVLRVRNSREEK